MTAECIRCEIQVLLIEIQSARIDRTTLDLPKRNSAAHARTRAEGIDSRFIPPRRSIGKL